MLGGSGRGDNLRPRRGAYRGGRGYGGGRGGQRGGRGYSGERGSHSERGRNPNHRSHSAQRGFQQAHGGGGLLMGTYESTPQPHRSRDRQTRPIGYKKLESMEKEMTPYDLVLTLARERSGLEQLLRGDRGKIDYGMTQMLLKVFAKMADCDGAVESLTHILQLLLKYEFETRIIDFIYSGILLELNPARRRQAGCHLTNVCKLLVMFLTVIPSTSRKKVSMTDAILSIVINGLGNVDEDVNTHYTHLKNMMENIEEKEKTKIERKPRFQAHNDDLHSRAPPSNFREIPVFPQLADIHGTAELFLRTNLIDKAYQDADHYLDVQFRLLREDFIRPLREGIAEIMHHIDAGEKKKKFFENVKVYKDVTVEYMKPDQKGILHRIKFSVEGLQRIRWRNTKRLLYGNLLCLSSDHFKANVHFAVVADRKPEDLQEGYLTVQFVEEEDEEDDQVLDEEDGFDLLDDGDEELGAAAPRRHLRVHGRQAKRGIDMKKVYTMVETDAYFEAYRHVLAGLKETEQIPLERYIVKCLPDMQAPEYLRPSVAGTTVRYDFSSVVDSDVFSKRVAVLDPYRWPSESKLGLDRTQAEALKLALTSELAIIQGPPGTGKTYVGLVIMKVLLANKTAWQSYQNPLLLGRESKHHFPILVVCYTNHALDQFLEGISQFSGREQTIVRVGGRCNNEVTKQFSLAQIRRDRRNKRESTSATTRQAIWDLKDSMRDIERRLQANCNQLEASLHCIQRLRELQNVMPSFLYNQFIPTLDQWQFSGHNSEDDVMLEWLGLTGMVEKIDFEEFARANIPPMILTIMRGFGHLDEDIGKAYHETGSVQPMQLRQWIITQKAIQQQQRSNQAATANDDDEEDNILGEADLVQQQRFLDTDEFQINQQKKHETSKRENEQEIDRLIRKMAAATFKDFTEDDHNNTQKEGWQQTRQDKKKKRQKIRHELGKTTTMEPMEEDTVGNIYDLSMENRWRLYRTWVGRWRDQFRVVSDQDIQRYNTFARRLDELRKREDSEILQSADVVAVTTTGAAKYRELIYNLNCKIVVIEEAAEVLEAHIITSMPKTTNHLILIGDHQQLKPSPTVYELARKFNLDTSLFERLISKIPHVTLNLQHRMRPSIADLLRPRIYKNLSDHESVLNRDDIVGVRKPLFFLTHEVLEESVADGRSKKNQFEADFLVELCKYLIMQGYESGQITILVMYTGQLFAFRETMRAQVCKGVRVTAVDNFQGEENDIILLSLVRSNDEQKIGFLSIENRICVALSRARSAMYCIGNMELLASKSPMWSRMVGHLKDCDSIGESLELQCKHHPDKIALVKCAKDFTKVPEGGCGQPCNARLDCGHTCPRPCHPEDHTNYECQKLCDKVVCELGHKCKKKCFQDCGPCNKPVQKIIPKCGHSQRIACSASPLTARCKEMVTAKIICGHEASIYCYQSENPSVEMCEEKCNTFLDCDHPCMGTCYECSQGRLHLPCLNKCNRRLVCGHACKSSCDNCTPCLDKCETRCEHNACKKKCGEPCIPCREKCKWSCKHYTCSMLCSEPCNRPPCNQPCEKLTKCKHPCIGLCGEPCPTLCRICNEEKVTEFFFGDEEEPDSRFVELEDCGHVFTYQNLDRWMNQKEEDGAIKMKECPRCKTPVWKSRRYGKIINDLLRSVNKVKEKTWGNKFEARRNREALVKEISKETEQSKKSVTFQMEKCQIKEELEKVAPESGKLVVLEEKYRRVQKLEKLKISISKLKRDMLVRNPLRISSFRFGRHEDGSDKVLDGIHQYLVTLLKWVMLDRKFSTEQERVAFQRETERIEESLKFTDIESKYHYHRVEDETVKKILDGLKKILIESFKPFDERRKEKTETCFKMILKLAPQLSSNLGITEEERKMICTAMGFAGKGHWYKCPKGHVYCIGDCGGATETSECPECKSKIGGASHRLLESNRIATEMDGATRPAYDPYNERIPDNLRAHLRGEGFEI